MTRPAPFAPLLALLSLALAGPTQAQVAPPAPTSLPTPLTLAQAVVIALAHQPQQYSARAQTSQALGQRQQARSQYFPVFTPSYQYQNNKRNLYHHDRGRHDDGADRRPHAHAGRGQRRHHHRQRYDIADNPQRGDGHDHDQPHRDHGRHGQ